MKKSTGPRKTSTTARHGLRLALAALAGLVLAWPAAAKTVDVTFLPPDLPAKKICLVRPSDADIIARWKKWDGKSLKGMDPDLVQSEARRLRYINATKYFDTVNRILDLLPTIDPSIASGDVTVDRIRLYLEAGRTGELKKQGLIEKLAANQDSLSPKALNILSGLYRKGQVVKADPARGLKMLVASANGGNADSLLQLAQITLAGQSVPGWKVDPKLTTTMAFGALVGKLNDTICNRIERIGREYAKGEVVTQNYAIAEKWYMMAADFGDPNAAWKVAQMNLLSEDVPKDNAVLLKYLKQAADGEIPVAEIELGKIYEAGALLPKDIDKAKALFRKAADQGNRGGLIRLATMLETIGQGDTQEHTRVLRRLTKTKNPPGWAYSKLAKVILRREGRWAGEDKAIPLLRKGVALDDPDSALTLASLLFHHVNKPGEFDKAVNLLIFAATTGGKTDAMSDLHDAYLCRAPSGPDLTRAQYWSDMEASAGNKTLFLQPDQISQLNAKTEPLTIAGLQTHALYGRPNALAYFLEYLRQNGASEDEIGFWRNRLEKEPAAETALAKVILGRNLDKGDLKRAVKDLRAAADAGLVSAEFQLGTVYLDYFPRNAEKHKQALDLLHKAAKSGYGKALDRLEAIARLEKTPADAIYTRFRDAIETRGNADALLFAATRTTNPSDKRDLLLRAASVMSCDFKNTIKLAQVYESLDEVPTAEHWLKVSLQLTDKNSWRYVAVADELRNIGGQKRFARALDLYRKAVAMGGTTAAGRLVKIYGNPDNDAYAPTKAAKMFETLLAKVEVPKIKDILRRLGNAPPAVRNIVLKDVSVEDVYRTRAEAGNAAAMRELGKYIRDHGTSVADAKEAIGWFRKAAAKGDTAAKVELAKAYALGVGLKPSIKQASLLLEEAANNGNAEAKQLLATMTPSTQE